MKLKLTCPLFLLIGLIFLLNEGTTQAWAKPATTTTTLTVSSGGSVLASGATLASGSKVTLTATVVFGSTKVTVGLVNFCDASALSCTDIHLLGTGQLTSAGTAVLSLHPPIGSHSYKAVFAGTPNGAVSYNGSASGTFALTVTGSVWPSVIDFTANSDVGDYTLTATVGSNAPGVPTGTVSFLDTSDANLELGSATLGSGSAGLDFLPSFTLPGTGGVGDFNNDGYLDVATVIGGYCITSYCQYGAVETLLGDGTGNFTASPQLVLDYYGGGGYVAVGDFNGDGNLDITVDAVSIYLGNGDGTFTNKGNAQSEIPYFFAVGDFNGDGIPDLVGINTSDLVILLIGNGDGTFTPSMATVSSAGSSPQSMVAGDFNGDGNLDLAIVNNNSPNPTGLTILLGNGNGSFTTLSSTLPTDYTGSIAAADFNGDGKLDLAITDPVDSTVIILLGNGDGTFAQAPGSPVSVPGDQSGEASGSITVGDFNGDGYADLAIGFAGGIKVLQGNGDGTFLLISPLDGQSSYFNSIYFSVYATGDFNDDGRSDLLTSSSVFLTANRTATAIATGISLPPATGANQVVANYSGDSSNTASTSSPITLSAGEGTPTVRLNASPNPATFGSTVTLTASVSGSGVTPTGTVIFYDGSVLLGTSTLNSSGLATYSSSTFAMGSNSLLVVYTGDSNYTSANSATVTLTITSGLPVPTLTVAPSSTSITTAQSLTVTVTVSSTTGPTPTGTVTLSSGSYTVQQTLVSGATSFTIAPGSLNIGTDTLTATYSGDGNYSATTGTGTVTVSSAAKPTPTVTVAPSSTSITAAQSLTIAVTVSGTTGGATPTGTVTLVSGSYSAEQTLASGTASFTIAPGSLNTGSNTLTATYSGDGNYSTMFGTGTVTVSPVGVAIPAPAAVTPGADTTTTATITASENYSGTINLTCALTTSPTGAESLPTCTLSPTSVTLKPSASGTSTLTVNTTAASTSAQLAPSHKSFWWPGEGGVVLALLLTFGIPARRRRLLLMLPMLCIVLVTLTIGCSGGSGGSSAINPPGNPATTAGNYIFTITGTDSTQATITTSTTVTVTVQ